MDKRLQENTGDQRTPLAEAEKDTRRDLVTPRCTCEPGSGRTCIVCEDEAAAFGE